MYIFFVEVFVFLRFSHVLKNWALTWYFTVPESESVAFKKCRLLLQKITFFIVQGLRPMQSERRLAYFILLIPLFFCLLFWSVLTDCTFLHIGIELRWRAEHIRIQGVSIRCCLEIGHALGLYIFMQLLFGLKMLVLCGMLVLNESYDFKDPSVYFVLELGKMDSLLLEEGEGLGVVEEVVHMAVNLVIVLIWGMLVLLNQ